MIAALLQDVHYTLRQFHKNPGFTATAAFTLALAISLTTTVFSVLDAVLIRPLPYDHSETIFYLETWSPQGYTQPASYPEYLDWRGQSHSFSALAAYNSYGSVNFEGPAGPVALQAVSATDTFFDVFGVRPLLGRTFVAGEEQAGKNDVAVLSHEVWQQNFGARRDALGETIKLDGRPYSVIGVMPAGFRYPVNSRKAIYTPLHLTKGQAEWRGAHWLQTVGRLRAGTSREQAQADLNQVFDDLGKSYPETKGRRIRLRDIHSFFLGNATAALRVLVVAVLALLAIGCVNIAGLLLARSVKRQREFALRSAVGAGRGRIVRQVLTETVLLAFLGAAGGALLSVGLLRAIRALLISALARGSDVQLDTPALFVALTAAIVTSLLAGLIPALTQSSIAPDVALRSGGRTGSSRRQHRLRAAFISVQMALALVLLLTSGLLLRTLAALRSTDLGFDPDHLLTAEISLSVENYRGRDLVADFYQPLIDRVRTIPGVKDVGVIQILPIQNWGWNSDVHIAGHPPNPPNQERLAESRGLSPGYFSALGIALVRGRWLDERRDTATSQPVAVVNEAFVKKFFAPGEDPLGKKIEWAQSPVIVGIVHSIRQNIYDPPLAEMDMSISQVLPQERLEYLSNMRLVVRTSRDPETIIPSLRQVFHELDPGLPFREPETMNDVVADVLVWERLENWLFGAFAALAVLLAIVGLYALISHELELSTRDIGVRMALGAPRVGVLGAIYYRVGQMLVGGTAAGLLATVAMQKLIASVVAIDAARDAAIVAGLAAGLVIAGLLSVVVPALRAINIDPMIALRYE